MSHIIEFQNVTKKYGDKIAVNDVSFKVDRGDVFGYLGPNGSGKTTSIRMMLDLLRPTSGKVALFGEVPSSHAVRKRIGLCLDYEGFYPDLTAYQNLEYFDRIFNEATDRAKRIYESLEKLGLQEHEKLKINDFSNGMRRRLGIARALLCKPELVILDEPTNGLDPDGQKLIGELLLYLAGKVTVFISSHNLNIIEDVCNKVAIIKRDCLFCGDVSAIDSPNTLVYSISFTNRQSIPEIMARLSPISYKIIEDRLIVRLSADRQHLAERMLAEHDLKLNSKKICTRKLENLYFSLIKENADETI